MSSPSNSAKKPKSSVGVQQLLENNRQWATEMTSENPDFFVESAKGQDPQYLYIGCADSRVPASGIMGTIPGEMFVHRNIANLVVNTDLNLLSVLQYAVEVLKVKDIMVVGHYGCGGVAAAAADKQYGLIDNWLTHIRNVVHLHDTELSSIKDEKKRARKLVELNVLEQVRNLAKTDIIQNAMRGEHPPRLHGLVYELADGTLKDLKIDGAALAREMKSIYGTEPH
ncbi:MAG TPA: carbonic anhydrase [Hymenobacter sp.]|uniref:carbonic anhydrase n=1 Tax=Hymenobacter sp. TaxID=1898978 RepID=UPI002ED7805A